MRLIDADALRLMFDSAKHLATVDPWSILDAAPTVRCEECSQECPSFVMWQRCEECMCGSNFKRRES